MKIVAAFFLALSIGAGSRWARIPSLAPQAVVGALLVVAMSIGYVLADRYLVKESVPHSSARTESR
jgi:XapX domain-containing protein